MKQYKILVVEDEVLLYDRISSVLTNNGYESYDYTPSVADAYEQIIDSKPDLVLLDINLQGKKTGVDLGIKLNSNFRIPFIYITDISDDLIFEKALASNPNSYLVKTKPFLNEQDLLRTIKVVLNKSSSTPKVSEEKHGIFLFVNYSISSEENGVDPNYRELVSFDDILLIEVDLHRNKFNNRVKGTKNYVRVTTRDGKIYYYNNSLTYILKKLPETFLRINRSVAINLLKQNVKGKTNQSSITLTNNETFYIGSAYKVEFENRMKTLFSS